MTEAEAMTPYDAEIIQREREGGEVNLRIVEKLRDKREGYLQALADDVRRELTTWSGGWCHECGAEPLPHGATLCSRCEGRAK